MSKPEQPSSRNPRRASNLANLLRPAIGLIALIASIQADNVSAATFRVTTKVFEGASLDAAAEHVILFEEGLVYDFPQIETRYVTIYDPARNQVTLLDRQTQVQTTVHIDDLINVTAQARAAAKTPEQQAQLGLQAKVEKSTKVNGYALRFGHLEYHVTTQRPKNPSIAADFAKFVDLASRLNLVRRLGPPPFGRMTLNQYLAASAEVPLETTLTLHVGDDSREYRSTHELEELGEISGHDRKRIQEVRGMLAVYRQVEMKDFP